MSITLAILYLMALTALGGAMMAVTSRKVLFPVFWLGLSLLGLSGLFLALGSPFVATMQMIIYIGGITVLMVFAVMMSISMAAPRAPRNKAKATMAALVSGSFFVVMALLLKNADFGERAQTEVEMWDVSRIGHMLLNEYNVAFEALSLLLTVAIIGSILIARREVTKS